MSGVMSEEEVQKMGGARGRAMLSRGRVST